MASVLAFAATANAAAAAAAFHHHGSADVAYAGRQVRAARWKSAVHAAVAAQRRKRSSAGHCLNVPAPLRSAAVIADSRHAWATRSHVAITARPARLVANASRTSRSSRWLTAWHPQPEAWRA